MAPVADPSPQTAPQTPSTPRRRTVRGRVVSATGHRGLSQAVVLSLGREVRCDADGRFAFEPASNDGHELFVRWPYQSRINYVVHGGDDDIDLGDLLMTNVAFAHVRVFDATGTPTAAEVMVTTDDETRPWRATVKTDANDASSVPVPSMPCHLVATRNGLAVGEPVFVQPADGDDVGVTLFMQRCEPLRVVVLNTAGKPAQASVWLLEHVGWDGGYRQLEYTHYADGSATFEVPPGWPCMLRVDPPCEHGSGWFDLPPTDAHGNVTLTVARLATVKARADVSAGRYIRCDAATDDASIPPAWHARGSSIGYLANGAVFENFWPGRWRLTLQQDGCFPQECEVTLQEGETRDLGTMTFAPIPDLELQVHTPNGDAASGALLFPPGSQGDRPLKAGHDGVLRVPHGAMPGPQVWRVFGRFGGQFGVQVPAVPPGTAVVRVSANIPGARIVGTVSTLDGALQAYIGPITVERIDAPGEMVCTAWLEKDGTFLTPLLAAGKYRVTPASDPDQSREVEVGLDGEVRCDLRASTNCFVYLRGQLLDDGSGYPATDAELVCSCPPAACAALQVTIDDINTDVAVSNEEGFWHLRAVGPTSRVWICIRHEGLLLPVAVDIPPSMTSPPAEIVIDLHVPPREHFGQVEVRTMASDGRDVAADSAVLEWADAPGIRLPMERAGNGWVAPRVAPGRWILRATRRGTGSVVRQLVMTPAGRVSAAVILQ
ncbi:MAG: hypothetical protein AB7S36_11355 [Planctomycetota bacterium]